MAQTIETSDEVSLTDVIAKVWRGRGWILLYSAIAVAIAAIAITAFVVRANRPIVYFIDLKGIADERYPGGAKFSPQNLIAPEVLVEVARRFNLDPSINLREAFSVSYGSPIVPGLQRYYQRRLEARNLSQVDLAAINTEYGREIEAATRSTLQIDVNYTLLGVNSSTGMAIARALPEIWTEVYSSRFNIFKDERLTPVVISPADEAMNNVTGVLMVGASMRAMKSGLKVLSDDSRFSALITTDGTSVAAIMEQLQNFDIIYFSTVKPYAFNDRSSVSATYITNTRLRLSEIQRNIAQYDASLDKLMVPRPGAKISDGSALGSAASVSKDGLQVGESGIQGIIDLAERASTSALVQEIMKKREELSLDASAIQRELEMLTVSQDSIDIGETRERAVVVLRELIGRYNELLSRADDTLRKQFKLLHTPNMGPIIAGSLLPTWSIPAMIGAGLFGGLIGLFVALLSKRRSVAL